MKAVSGKVLKKIWSDILVTPLSDAIQIEVVVTDSRKVSKNSTFFAIKGERFDGHDFIQKVFEQGAAWVVGEKAISRQIFSNYIQVTDTRLALGLLARFIRQNFFGCVFGLTGSVGKTTTKEMLLAICKEVGDSYATKGNLNNDLGVPFTWFDLPDNCDYAIIEMGANHQKEIAYLSDITCPSIALVTNAGQAHLEGFGGIKGVAKGKGELYQSLKKGQIAIINSDDDFADYWINLLDKDVDVYLYGWNKHRQEQLLRKDGVNIRSVLLAKNYNPSSNSFDFEHQQQLTCIQLSIPGQHNALNALGAIACTMAAGFDKQAIQRGIAKFMPPKGRLQQMVLGRLTIIDDSYNANPTSVSASSNILSEKQGYRVMVLGDMAELGEDSVQLHANLGEELIDKADQFLCLGQLMTGFVSNNHKATHFINKTLLKQQLVQTIHQQVDNEITVLVKGSRSMAMEEIVEHLHQQFGKS